MAFVLQSNPINTKSIILRIASILIEFKGLSLGWYKYIGTYFISEYYQCYCIYIGLCKDLEYDCFEFDFSLVVLLPSLIWRLYLFTLLSKEICSCINFLQTVEALNWRVEEEEKLKVTFCKS